MATSSHKLLLLLLSVHGSFQKSSPTSSTYRAAVVELNPIEYTNDAAKTMDDCAEKIVSFIEQGAIKEADIVVFPEMGLTSLYLAQRADLVARSTVVPDPSDNYAPCNDSRIPVHEALKKVACAAELNDIYVVVNLLEKTTCSSNNCHSDGVFVYITSVVFDRKGIIIARSRKAHLVDEFNKIDVLETPEPSVFDTDFGVTFGSLICFDLFYDDTLLPLTRKLNVTDIVLSSGWYAEMPFLTTIQMEAGFAHAEDVNLIAAGYNNIGWGNTGSGIYAGRQGVVTAILPLDRHEELLVADVRKKDNKALVDPELQNNHEYAVSLSDTDQEDQHRKFHRVHASEGFQWRYENLNAFETEVIAKNGLTVETLSHNGIDCEFQVTITDLSPLGVTYRLVAYDGVHYFGNTVQTGTRICAIVLCANDTINSCGHISDSSATFHSIKIIAIYEDNARTIMMPNTLRTDMMPFKTWTWNQHKYEERIHTSMSLTTPTQNLVSFGIWGRNFEKDARSSVSRFFSQLLCLPLLLVLLRNVRVIF